MSNLNLAKYGEDAYLQYALAVVKDRAVAQVQDGLKPVQRRILYAMGDLGMGAPGAKYRKSAVVVGNVLGKYHPHGDSSVYDAQVRMAQNFSLRYPLVDGQGNYGDRDGSPAAAMRYSEARLMPISDLLLGEVHMGTVDFIGNYDDSEKEPILLPARLPVLLLNGTMGIAVGLRSDIPSHNLREVAQAAAMVIRNPEVTLPEILEVLPGPDFPDGGQLSSSAAEIAQTYETGKGRFRVRARWVKEDLARAQWQVAITELPYQISPKTILEEIAALTNPEPAKGKKTLSAEQVRLKQVALDYLEKVTNESDKDNPIRIVLVPRTSKIDMDAMMRFLLAHTSLEVAIQANMNVISLDGRPAQRGLLGLLQEWGVFRVNTVRRRTRWELDAVERRIHILEGRLVVFLRLDEVIKVVREADVPKTELIGTFGLSETQADDILEMRLRQLNKLEGFKLEKELDSCNKEAARLRKLLESDKALRAVILKEIEADAAKFGDDRRTLIQAEASVVAPPPSQMVDEPVTLVLTKNLWLRALKGHEVDLSGLTFKQGDSLLFSVATRTRSTVGLLDDNGRAYSFSAGEVPVTRGDGVPLSTLAELQDGAAVVGLLDSDPERVYLFASDEGYGYRAPLKALFGRQKAGKAFLTVTPGSKAMAPVAVGPTGFIAVQSSDGRVLAFPVEEVKALDKGKGVMLINGAEPVTRLQFVTDLAEKVADWPGLAEHLGKRGSKGKVPVKKAKRTKA